MKAKKKNKLKEMFKSISARLSHAKLETKEKLNELQESFYHHLHNHTGIVKSHIQKNYQSATYANLKGRHITQPTRGRGIR